MTNKFKTAFDCICAEDKLKESALAYLQDEIQKRAKPRSRVSFKRLAAVLSSVVILIFSGVFSYNLYFTPNAYVDVDINPSVELTINLFDRIIGVYAYNSDGEDILSKLDLKHKNYEEALISLITTIDKNGYIQDNSLVSVTLQTASESREYKLLTQLQDDITAIISAYNAVFQADVFAVSGDTREEALKYNISPAKYLAILELMDVDPTATVESCRGHSIGEIKQMTRERHGSGHGSDFGNTSGDHHGGNENGYHGGRE